MAVDPGGIVGAALGATPAAGVPGRVPSVAEDVPVPGPLIGLIPDAAGDAVCGHPGMLGKDTCVAMAVVRAFNMDVSWSTRAVKASFCSLKSLFVGSPCAGCCGRPPTELPCVGPGKTGAAVEAAELAGWAAAASNAAVMAADAGSPASGKPLLDIIGRAEGLRFRATKQQSDDKRDVLWSTVGLIKEATLQV